MKKKTIFFLVTAALFIAMAALLHYVGRERAMTTALSGFFSTVILAIGSQVEVK